MSIHMLMLNQNHRNHRGPCSLTVIAHKHTITSHFKLKKAIAVLIPFFFLFFGNDDDPNATSFTKAVAQAWQVWAV